MAEIHIGVRDMDESVIVVRQTKCDDIMIEQHLQSPHDDDASATCWKTRRDENYEMVPLRDWPSS